MLGTIDLNYAELPHQAPQVARVLIARGGVFIHFNRPGDSYRILLALGPLPKEVTFAVIDRGVAVVLPANPNAMSASYLKVKCEGLGTSDFEPLAQLLTFIGLELSARAG